jgi:hypothetical protein
MVLRDVIKEIFEQNTDYARPEQAINQSQSLNALSRDLYTEAKRFIYELLQNADDSAIIDCTVNVSIRLFGNHLVVAHSGRPFDKRDLRGLCGVNDGTKKNAPDKTGFKGIGFKAVFGQSEKVYVFSQGEYFRFDAGYRHSWPAKWGVSQTMWERENDRLFEFPWQIIPIYTKSEDLPPGINDYLLGSNWTVATIVALDNTNETIEAVRKLSASVNMFLFLKNVDEIHFEVGERNLISIGRLAGHEVVLKLNSTVKARWLLRSIHLVVPDRIKASLQIDQNIPPKLKAATKIELTLAAKIGENGIEALQPNEGLLYAYLPTEEQKYSLPVLVNSAFLTVANREYLHADSLWNQWLFFEVPKELFNWIAELVVSRFRYQAYKIIPDKLPQKDALTSEFNKGFEESIQNTPFVITGANTLLTVKEAIIDFTFLSDKPFIGQSAIRTFIVDSNESTSIHPAPFVGNTGSGNKLKMIGVASFEWNKVPELLNSDKFLQQHSVEKNTNLLQYFKDLSEAEKPADVNENSLKNWPFILDHKNKLIAPKDVFYPSPDDTYWNSPNSELSFLHPQLQDWLLENQDIKLWLDNLGVVEKSDLTYLKKTVLPSADRFITMGNAVSTIQNIFYLHQKGDINNEFVASLSSLKLLTLQNTLLTAHDCYFSDDYSPRVPLEKSVMFDFYLNSSYMPVNADKAEWKRFFKLLGVKEGFPIINYPDRISVAKLTAYQFVPEYFDLDDKKFQPVYTRFTASEYGHFLSIFLLPQTIHNPGIAKLLWTDVIKFVPAQNLSIPAIAYWGNRGYPGWSQGDHVSNYVEWFTKTQECLPVVTGECLKATSILLNSSEIKSIAGKYLPVFDGPELSSDWKSFFSFRTILQLSDYLNLLSKVALEIDENGRVKNDNYKRIQSVYLALLNQCVNWSTSEILEVEEWANTGYLLSTKQQFVKANDLKYFLDGNESVFQDQFYFLALNAENKNHPNLKDFLTPFKVKILQQSDFELEHTQTEICSDLISVLKGIAPYFKTWVEDEIQEDKTGKHLENLNKRIAALNIYEAEELKIKYAGIAFAKAVSLHFDETNLYVTHPWRANSVLLKLSEVLCRYFDLTGHDKKLDFLLRSANDEIVKYFLQESLTMPDTIVIVTSDARSDDHVSSKHINSPSLHSFEEIENAVEEGQIIPEEFFHTSRRDYEALKYAEGLISRSVNNIIKHLTVLPDYDCSAYYMIAKSIIGGITKNGNDITVVARPSDEDAVLIYYTSEFDVLEYVDAEFWCEDGINVPKQITLGQLLKQTGINRIPIRSINHLDFNLETLQNQPKTEIFDFDPVPFAPQKIAKIISSFANTNGGRLIFGLKETSPATNEIVGLSTDFRVVEITRHAISLLLPIPSVSYDWIKIDDKSLFVIEIEKAENSILLDQQKYMRVGGASILEESQVRHKTLLNAPVFNKTQAIIIAIENYAPREENQIAKVKYAEDDALKFKQLLIEVMNVAEDDIYMFTNENALKSNLEYEFKGLFHHLTEEDRLIFYYVGHGFHNGITNYLSTYDMHKSNIAETAVSLRKILLDPLQKSKCKHALIFIDACAQSFQEENERSQIFDINDEELMLLTNEFPNYATFLSCQAGQSSYSSDNLKNGIWTYHLTKALRGDVAEVLHSNKYITDRSLNDYLSINVARYTKEELGYDQNPKAILDSNGESIIVEIKFKNIE